MRRKTARTVWCGAIPGQVGRLGAAHAGRFAAATRRDVLVTDNPGHVHAGTNLHEIAVRRAASKAGVFEIAARRAASP